MTKLHEVVRGVEVKKIKLLEDNPKALDALMGGRKEGYNSLASAEVIVDSEKMANLISREFLPKGHMVKDGAKWEYSLSLAQAIATAIESGSIISLKEEK